MPNDGDEPQFVTCPACGKVAVEDQRGYMCVACGWGITVDKPPRAPGTVKFYRLPDGNLVDPRHIVRVVTDKFGTDRHPRFQTSVVYEGGKYTAVYEGDDETEALGCHDRIGAEVAEACGGVITGSWATKPISGE